MVSRRSGRYLETFLEPVASLCSSIDPWRAMVTPFMPKTMKIEDIGMFFLYKKELFFFLYKKTSSSGTSIKEHVLLVRSYICALVQEEQILLVQEEHVLLAQAKHVPLVQEEHFVCTRRRLSFGTSRKECFFLYEKKVLSL